MSYSNENKNYFDGKTNEEIKAILNHNGYMLEFLKDQTEELCLIAVKSEGDALRYVKKQTAKICQAAVKNDGLALKYVKRPSKKIQIAAIENDAYAIEFCKDQTMELQRLAVRKNGYSISEIRGTVHVEICDLAVNQAPRALKFIKHQTINQGVTAMLKDPMASRCVARHLRERVYARVSAERLKGSKINEFPPLRLVVG